MRKLIGGLGLMLGLAAWPAAAQLRPGNGLKGSYYDGLNFDTFIATRIDPVMDFAVWQRPAGIPLEDFSVRWTGWLVAPATGRYVLTVVVDDGARLWLDGRQLLNEWRGQSQSLYTVSADLVAGRAYPLRLDYCQYSRDGLVRLSWQRPDEAAQNNSWRNLWGAVSSTTPTAVVPTRYLYSANPLLPAVPAIKPAAKPIAVRAAAESAAPPRPIRPVRLAAVQTRPAVRPVTARPVRVRQPVPPAPAPRPDMAAQLASGQAVTLRALYFEQGRAELPVAVQASLDTLARALAQQPTLRLQVQGHTDNQGEANLNQQLSQQRAEAVCHYLAAHGVAAERLQAVGYGGTQPVADNNVPAERPRNRRVVLQPLP